jgi:transposase
MARPTKYSKKLAKKLPELFTEGKSVVEVCVELGIWKDTFYRWAKEHPEFSDAYQRGLDLSQAWWERLGRGGASGEMDIQPTTWIFNMKNRFHWTDRVEQNIDLNGEVNITNLSPQERDNEIKELLSLANVQPEQTE